MNPSLLSVFRLSDSILNKNKCKISYLVLVTNSYHLIPLTINTDYKRGGYEIRRKISKRY